MLPLNLASWEDGSWGQTLLLGQDWDVMGCKCLESHLDLEVRSLANPLRCCSGSGKVKILPRCHRLMGHRETGTEVLVWGCFWSVYGEEGVCGCFLMSLPKELPPLGLPLAAQLLLCGGSSSEPGELFLPWLCEGVRSDAGGKRQSCSGKGCEMHRADGPLSHRNPVTRC